MWSNGWPGCRPGSPSSKRGSTAPGRRGTCCPRREEQLTAAEAVLQAARGRWPTLRRRLRRGDGRSGRARPIGTRRRSTRGRRWSRRASPGWPPNSPRSCVDGEPCPVCGSTEHPRPAAPASTTRSTAAADPGGAGRRTGRRRRAGRAVQRRWRAGCSRSAGRSGVGRRSDPSRWPQAELTECPERHDRLAAVARNLDALLGLREAAGKALFEQGLRREDLATSLAAGSTADRRTHPAHRQARRAAAQGPGRSRVGGGPPQLSARPGHSAGRDRRLRRRRCGLAGEQCRPGERERSRPRSPMPASQHLDEAIGRRRPRRRSADRAGARRPTTSSPRSTRNCGTRSSRGWPRTRRWI